MLCRWRHKVTQYEVSYLTTGSLLNTLISTHNQLTLCFVSHWQRLLHGCLPFPHHLPRSLLFHLVTGRSPRSRWLDSLTCQFTRTMLVVSHASRWTFRAVVVMRRGGEKFSFKALSDTTSFYWRIDNKGSVGGIETELKGNGEYTGRVREAEITRKREIRPNTWILEGLVQLLPKATRHCLLGQKTAFVANSFGMWWWPVCLSVSLSLSFVVELQEMMKQISNEMQRQPRL